MYQPDPNDPDVGLFRQELALRRAKGYVFISAPTRPCGRPQMDSTETVWDQWAAYASGLGWQDYTYSWVG